MKLAIDIDGTITKYPKEMLYFLTAFPDSVILTGHLLNSDTNLNNLQLGRINQLKPLIGEIKWHIEICTGNTSEEVAYKKAVFCKNNKIDVFIDDSQSYCDAVKKISPSTAILKAI